MRMKKIGLLGLALVLALALTGAGFAHWSDTVKIEGTAEMGSLTFGFTEIVGEWDYEDWLVYYNITAPPPKEVGSGNCTLSVAERDNHTEKTVYKLLTFNVTGAYPQYWAINKFTLVNAGTIPLCVHNVTVTLPAGVTLSQSTEYPDAMWDVMDADGKVVYNIWLYKEPVNYGPGWAIDPPWEFPGAVGTETGVRKLVCNQIDPCNALLTEICVDFKQDAEECHTYTFEIEIEAIQWNKHVGEQG